MTGTERFEAIAATLKVAVAVAVAVAALRDAQVPFVLAGSFAAWARGGPEPQRDLDLMLRPEHAKAAVEALVKTGMRPERPPEEWLLKAWRGDVVVDLIFCPAGLEMTDEVFERAESMPVMSVQTPVMTLEDALITKFYALDEHSLD